MSLDEAEKKLEKAFAEYVIAKVKSNTTKAEKNVKGKLTSKEWKQLDKAINKIVRNATKQAENNPTLNLFLLIQDAIRKLEAGPIYAEIIGKLEPKINYIN